MRAKFAELMKVSATQASADRALELLDQQFQRGDADQQRPRTNLQSVGNGDTKARFEKLLNSTEDKLESIEKARVEQRKIIDGASNRVSQIIRSF